MREEIDGVFVVQLHRPAISTILKSVDDTFPYPYNELLIWAVLTKRHQMALFFWERGKSKDFHLYSLSNCFSSVQVKKQWQKVSRWK